MTALLPHQKFEIKTRLSSVAARQKLMEIVEPRRMRWGWSRNHLPFEGEVEVNTFRFCEDVQPPERIKKADYIEMGESLAGYYSDDEVTL